MHFIYGGKKINIFHAWIILLKRESETLQQYPRIYKDHRRSYNSLPQCSAWKFQQSQSSGLITDDVTSHFFQSNVFFVTIRNRLQVGTKLEYINIEFRLSLTKPLNGKWLVEYYNYICSQAGTEVIVNRFKIAGIYDAIRWGKSSLKSIYPFNDITPLADSLSEDNPGNFVQLSDDLREGYVFE